MFKTMKPEKSGTFFSLLAIVLIFGGVVQTVIAQNQNVTHTVQKGETLFSIAQRYNVDIEQLRDWNKLTGNQLRVGQVLVVRKSGADDNPKAVTHKVQAQETLFSISKQYGVTIPEIKSWNNLTTNTLDLGQELVLYPSDQQGTSSDGTSSSPLVVNTPVSNNTYYTVKSGDTLYKIAQQHNMTVDELKALNDLSSNTIRIGQRLTVRQTQSAPSVSDNVTESSPQGSFVNLTLQQQENLKTLLSRFKISEEEFYALNPDLNSSTLRAGQKITVLAPPSTTHENPYTVRATLKNLGETPVSYYKSTRAGTTTTSGELYNPNQLTAAHSNIELGSVIFVRNPTNGRGVYVRINDRFSGKGLKLSQAALNSLGMTGSVGSASVNIFQDQ